MSKIVLIEIKPNALDHTDIGRTVRISEGATREYAVITDITKEGIYVSFGGTVTPILLRSLHYKIETVNMT